MSRAFSVIELLIAMAIATIVISGVVVGTVGNAGGFGAAVGGKQTVVSDGETNSEALRKAQDLIEEAAATARTNYSSVVEKTVPDSRYLIKLTIPTAYTLQCSKAIAGNVSWTGSYGRPSWVAATTTIVNIPEMIALAGDCATEPPLGGWKNPHTLEVSGVLMSRDLQGKPNSPPAGYNDNPAVDSSAGTPATDIDVTNKMIYMTADSNKDNFFVLDGSDILTGIVPPITGSLKIGTRLSALDVADVSGSRYAFVAYDSKFGQLQVINLTDPNNPSRIASASSTLATLTPGLTCPGSNCPGGRSIYYYDHKVYLGTHYLPALNPSQNHEFHVFDVTDPTHPDQKPNWSFNVEHNVNAIVVRKQKVAGVQKTFAYLATSGDTKEVVVLDVTDPAITTELGSFDAKNMDDTANGVDGTSLFLVGNKLFLGREKVSQSNSAQRDFYVIDVSNLASPSSLGSVNLQVLTGSNFGSGVMVTGIYVVGKYAFVVTNDSNTGFIVLDISNPAAITLVSTFNYANNNTSVDFEDDLIYTANSQNDGLRIIMPSKCANKIDDDSDGKIDSRDSQCHTDGNANNAASYNPDDDNES